MPKPTKGPRLGGGPAHERLMLNNLASQLFEHRSITTTEAKAKRMRPVAERLVTFAKRGDLHARRRVMRSIGDKTVVHELFTEIAPLVMDRHGGYTRITKTGFRKGDNAPMAVIELVLEPVASSRTGTSTRSSARSGPRQAAAASTAPAESTSEVPVESTDAIEESAPVTDESATPAAEEVESSAAEVGDDAPEPEGPAADEPKPDDESPATPTT